MYLAAAITDAFPRTAISLVGSRVTFGLIVQFIHNLLMLDAALLTHSDPTASGKRRDTWVCRAFAHLHFISASLAYNSERFFACLAFLIMAATHSASASILAVVSYAVALRLAHTLFPAGLNIFAFNKFSLDAKALFGKLAPRALIPSFLFGLLGFCPMKNFGLYPCEIKIAFKAHKRPPP